MKQESTNNVDNKYTNRNGWSNPETRTVEVWLENKEQSYRYWKKKAAEIRRRVKDHADVLDGGWSTQEVERLLLADVLKTEITGASPIKEKNLFGDLLNAAMSEVNWEEVAQYWLHE